MSEPVYFLTLGLFFGTILVVFGMRYRSANLQARARLADERSYRELAARAVSDQATTATAVSRIQESLADIGRRIATIERILEEVD